MSQREKNWRIVLHLGSIHPCWFLWHVHILAHMDQDTHCPKPVTIKDSVRRIIISLNRLVGIRAGPIPVGAMGVSPSSLPGRHKEVEWWNGNIL